MQYVDYFRKIFSKRQDKKPQDRPPAMMGNFHPWENGLVAAIACFGEQQKNAHKNHTRSSRCHTR